MLVRQLFVCAALLAGTNAMPLGLSRPGDEAVPVNTGWEQQPDTQPQEPAGSPPSESKEADAGQATSTSSAASPDKTYWIWVEENGAKPPCGQPVDTPLSDETAEDDHPTKDEHGRKTKDGQRRTKDGKARNTNNHKQKDKAGRGKNRNGNGKPKVKDDKSQERENAEDQTETETNDGEVACDPNGFFEKHIITSGYHMTVVPYEVEDDKPQPSEATEAKQDPPKEDDAAASAEQAAPSDHAVPASPWADVVSP